MYNDENVKFPSRNGRNLSTMGIKDPLILKQKWKINQIYICGPTTLDILSMSLHLLPVKHSLSYFLCTVKQIYRLISVIYCSTDVFLLG